MREFFTNELIKGNPFTFTKYGDGELLCVYGSRHYNCDGHNYTEGLQKALIKSWIDFVASDRVWVGKWQNVYREYYSLLKGEPQWADYHTFIPQEGKDDSNLYKFYRKLKESNREIVFVAPERLNGFAQIMNAKHITIPLVNCWESYEQTKEQLLSNKHDIYIYCASMMSKVLIADVMRENKGATQIDVGSGLDCFFVEEPTRANQPKAYGQFPVAILLNVLSSVPSCTTMGVRG